MKSACEQDTRRRPKLAHDGAVAFHIRDLTAAQRDRNREAQSVAAEVGLGREATARAAKNLVLIPFSSTLAAC